MTLHPLRSLSRYYACFVALLLVFSGPTLRSVAAAEHKKYCVVLESSGSDLDAVIKAVRKIAGLGLEEASDLVKHTPALVAAGCSKSEAATKRSAILDEVPARDKPTVSVQEQSDPNFEVHFLLSADEVLNSSGELRKKLETAFEVEQDVTELRMQFVDTPAKAFHKQGWNIRIRKLAGHDSPEITFKWRLPVSGELDDALGKAAAHGFDASEDNYAAQVEWSTSRKTLTFSRQKDLNPIGEEVMKLPGAVDSRQAALEALPGKLKKWLPDNWAEQGIEGARVYGPVHGKRRTGSWNDQKVALEIWEIKGAGDEPLEKLVELSAKIDELDEASRFQSEMGGFLKDKAWIDTREKLKTEMILERY